LVHVDTEAAHENLVNSRLAYVSVSRARDDAQIFTNDAAALDEAFGREVSKATALDAEISSGTHREEEKSSEHHAPSGSPEQSQVEREQTEDHAMGF
jgi:ATP-dependent exoDNAse (exonuclease V) alpha subunit